MTRAEMKRKLILSDGGTPKELAKLCGVGPQDSTFKRALADAVEVKMLFPSGTTQDRRYLTRTEAFGIMSAAANKVANGGSIGGGGKSQARPKT